MMKLSFSDTSSPVISDEDMKRAAALWILKTRELHRIPQSVMDEMLGDIQSLFQMSLSGISERIRATLSEASIVFGKPFLVT